MDADFNFSDAKLKIGDIVCEIDYIVPPDRKQWYGMVVDIVRDHYHEDTWSGYPEDMITVQWFGDGIMEHLPAPVLVLIQQAK